MNSVNGNGNGNGISLWELMQQAQQRLGKSLSFPEISVLLQISQLAHQDYYSINESDQFLSICQQYRDLDCNLDSLRAAQAATGMKTQLEAAAQKKSLRLGEQISGSMALLEHQLSEMMPSLLQSQLNQLLATPGLLEEMITEAAKHLLATETAGYSESSQYQSWLDGKERILRRIYRRLKVKSGWGSPN